MFTFFNKSLLHRLHIYLQIAPSSPSAEDPFHWQWISYRINCERTEIYLNLFLYKFLGSFITVQGLTIIIKRKNRGRHSQGAFFLFHVALQMWRKTSTGTLGTAVNLGYVQNILALVNKKISKKNCQLGPLLVKKIFGKTFFLAKEPD